MAGYNWGSSPLTRGKQGHAPRQRDISGLIPAHAGKTDSRPRHAVIRWAHPRSRGENANGGYAANGVVGSSPLTRGKHLARRVAPHVQGLIPAHAGKTGVFVVMMCM